ncbi:carboxymuconolactone decarboxylase family protein [Candidatus Methylacidithermus pantelleriae]|uniref:carboxymuconolactone decarboxylase family protein n=1 Tax=Candidatus Methylacidithermus pantelleriae TaxID=2744239 RepID=UPI001BD5DDC1
MSGIETHIRESGFERSLRELITIRASQLYGCPFCIHMHTKGTPSSGREQTTH